MKTQETRTYNLLINDEQCDPSTIAVMKDVNLKEREVFIANVELILQEHYGVNTVSFKDGFPEWISSQSYPRFQVEYEAESEEDHYSGELDISCVAIY
jgi:hypothetical protein